MTAKFIRADVLEAAAAMRVIGTALLAAAQDTGAAGADLQFAVSSLIVDAETQIRAGAIGSSMAACFDLSRLASATYTGMVAVVSAAETLVPIDSPAKVVATAGVRYGLGQIARILSRATFASRNDVDVVTAIVGGMFDRAESYAAGNGDIAAYAALVGLHAAVIADLTARSRLLPRVVRYAFPRTFSALSLAHRIYGDASRAAELVAENGAFNAAFMPRSGIALSA